MGRRGADARVGLWDMSIASIRITYLRRCCLLAYLPVYTTAAVLILILQAISTAAIEFWENSQIEQKDARRLFVATWRRT